MHYRAWPTRLAVLTACIGGAAVAADDIKPLDTIRFAPDPDVRCLSSAVETGDPKTGRSTLILKAPADCVVPWHSHTAEEQLIVVTGRVLSEMLDHKSSRLGPGGFAVMGSRMPHQLTCVAQEGSCLSRSTAPTTSFGARTVEPTDLVVHDGGGSGRDGSALPLR